MNLFYTICQALLQGITEFLPVSSSGHLVLFQQFFSVEQPHLFMDVVFHAGTLLSILVWFRKDIFLLTQGAFQKDPVSRRILYRIILTAIPTAVLGLLIKKFFPGVYESVFSVLIFLFLTALILYFSDHLKSEQKKFSEMAIGPVLFLGLIQGLSVLPGLSRSGWTITACLLLGLSRKESARASFLIAIPALLGALILEGHSSLSLWDPERTLHIIVGISVSFLTGLAGIFILMKLLIKAKFKYFSFYLTGLIITLFLIRLISSGS